ncbi:MAG: hypothetical protein IH945_04455 [Armatimonadetes bacterium]|nr:hypothetical protein [Armatimonadota bacterium]
MILAAVAPMGWAVNEYRGLKNISHGGGIFGFNTSIMRFVEQKVTVVVLSNNPQISAWSRSEKIAEMYLFDEMAAR